jgi:hypothetical protein
MLGFESKAIVAINDQSLVSSFKIAQTAYQALQPQYIVVADHRILPLVISSSKPEQLQNELTMAEYPYQIITEYSERGLQQLGPLNFLSYAVHYMINRGVPINSLYLVLMLPVMATIIAAARQIVGVKSFGIFVPTVTALSFLATGLKYGLVLFLAIIIVGTLARLIARKFRLLYLPRMAIVLSMLALTVFGMFLLGAVFGLREFIGISIFPLLIMTVLAEHFIAVQIEQGYKTALKLTVETLIVSIIGYLIGDWAVFKTTILAYPELVLLTFVFNFLLGKFAGLRLVEYIRFRNVFKYSRNVAKSK